MSRTVTLLAQGAHKAVHYVEGSAHDLGYLMGLMVEPEVSQVCGGVGGWVRAWFVDVTFSACPAFKQMVHTYVDHFLISLISASLDIKLSSSPTWSGLYDELVSFLGDFLALGERSWWL